jgi:hypothetical protein
VKEAMTMEGCQVERLKEPVTREQYTGNIVAQTSVGMQPAEQVRYGE